MPVPGELAKKNRLKAVFSNNKPDCVHTRLYSLTLPWGLRQQWLQKYQTF
jgi:hypothetical protein